MPPIAEIPCVQFPPARLFPCLLQLWQETLITLPSLPPKILRNLKLWQDALLHILNMVFVESSRIPYLSVKQIPASLS